MKSVLLLAGIYNTVLATPILKLKDPVGILWIKTKQTESMTRRLQFEKETVDQLENQLGRPVVKSELGKMIPEETFRLAKSKQKLQELVEQLSKIVFQLDPEFRSEKKYGNELIHQMNRLASQLPRGTFGPELQTSRLVQAAWHWRNKNKKMFERLSEEARNMHPLRELNFYEFSEEPLAHVFEGDYLRLMANKSETGICELKQRNQVLEMEQPIWINGFKIKNKNIKVFPGNYVLIQRNQQGKLFEKIMRCSRDGFSNHRTEAWMPVKNQLRIEYLIPSEFEKTKDLLILAEESKKIRKYQLRNLKDLREWSPEEDSVPLRLAPETSFESLKEERWYNKSQVWWIAGAVVGAGAWVISRITEINHPVSLKIKFNYGP